MAVTENDPSRELKDKARERHSVIVINTELDYGQRLGSQSALRLLGKDSRPLKDLPQNK